MDRNTDQTYSHQQYPRKQAATAKDKKPPEYVNRKRKKGETLFNETDMRDLNYQRKQLCRRNQDGNHATWADREQLLSLAASNKR